MFATLANASLAEDNSSSEEDVDTNRQFPDQDANLLNIPKIKCTKENCQGMCFKKVCRP